MGITPAKYAQMQKEWYAKLASEGFQDIEDPKRAEEASTQSLKRPATKARHSMGGKEAYYALCRNFLTHNNKWFKWEKPAFAAHCEGISYRNIVTLLNKHHKCNKSIYWLYYFMAKTIKRMHKFNREHPEGLLNPANADSWTDDVLLKASHQQDLGQEAHQQELGPEDA